MLAILLNVHLPPVINKTVNSENDLGSQMIFFSKYFIKVLRHTCITLRNVKKKISKNKPLKLLGINFKIWSLYALPKMIDYLGRVRKQKLFTVTFSCIISLKSTRT